MASGLIDVKPSFAKHDETIHLRYELPHRVYSSIIYPVRAPNGSTILVYGHTNGLSVVWRGGRRFRKKSEAVHNTRSQSQGAGSKANDAIMIIDSDEEGQPLSESHVAGESEVEFESLEDDADTAEPYDQIIDVLCVELGANVVHVAAPPLPQDVANRSAEYIPPLFGQKLVVAAACSDSSAHLIAVPLTPSPSRATGRQATEAQKKNIDIVLASAPQPPSRSIPRAIALTWTSKRPGMPVNQDDGVQERGRARNRHSESPSWDVVVSWISGEGSGATYTSIIPLEIGGRVDPDFIGPSLREHLPAPAVTLSFNPSRYPSRRHTQILLAGSKGVAHVYDPMPHRSMATDSRTDEDELPHHSSGHWIASLYGPFRQNETDSTVERKRILDAQWALDGKCIMAVFGDGQWGVWDIEGVGPAGRSNAARGNNGTSKTRGLMGGGVTFFALRGFVSEKASTVNASSEHTANSSRGSTAKSTGNLQPMTPKTRKTKQDTLFSGPAITSPTPRVTRGGLSLTAKPLTDSGQFADDSVLIWYGDSVFAMPSLMQYWQRVANSNSNSSDQTGAVSAGAPFGPNLPKLPNLSTGGEMITSLAQLPHRQPASSSAQRLRHDILISAEHRLLIVCAPKPPPQQRPGQNLSRLFQAPARQDDDGDEEMAYEGRLDQDLLARNELGLDGVGRILDGLADPAARAQNTGAGFRNAARRTRRVGFAADQ